MSLHMAYDTVRELQDEILSLRLNLEQLKERRESLLEEKAELEKTCDDLRFLADQLRKEVRGGQMSESLTECNEICLAEESPSKPKLPDVQPVPLSVNFEVFNLPRNIQSAEPLGAQLKARSREFFASTYKKMSAQLS